MSAAAPVSAGAGILVEFVAALFTAAGLGKTAARSVAAALVEADLCGIHSHGVMLTDMYVKRLLAGSVSSDEDAELVSDNGATAILDARNAFGVLTGDAAMALAVTKAKDFGVGIVAVRHAFHFGTARRFAEAAARADCIGIAMCNTRPLMPAPGGAEKVVGNNPIAIAIPTTDDIPLVLDMATSEAAMGKIRLAAKSGGSIPASWAVRADGSPTSDPNEAINGMLLPSAGPKGFGLALMIDLMCGLLSGGAFGADVKPLYGDLSEPYDCSHLFLAISLPAFGDAAAMKASAARAAVDIRGGRRAANIERLYTPGEPEWDRRARSGGNVLLEPATVGMLVGVASDLNVAVPDSLRLNQEQGARYA